jgi:hypothetical protein
MAQLLSVNVGLPREIEWKGKTVYTAVWKGAVQVGCATDKPLRRISLLPLSGQAGSRAYLLLPTSG